MQTPGWSRPEPMPREMWWRRLRMLVTGLALIGAAALLDALLRRGRAPPLTHDAAPSSIEAGVVAPAARRATIPR